jgi:hypothetical protein
VASSNSKETPTLPLEQARPLPIHDHPQITQAIRRFRNPKICGHNSPPTVALKDLPFFTDGRRMLA